MHGLGIYINGRQVALSPSLRAAVSLHRTYGVPRLIADVAKGKVSAIRPLVLATMLEPNADTADALAKAFLNLNRGEMHDHMVELALGLIGASASDVAAMEDGDATQQPVPKKEPADYGAMYARLFELGTGWLGWSPKETLDATPGQIMAAHSGRIAMLKAIFGSDEKGKTKGTPGKVSAEDPAKIDALAMSLARRWGAVEA